MWARTERGCKEMNKEMPTYLSIPQTSKKLGISIKTLRDWCKENKIPHIRIGQKFMIDVPKTLEKLRSGEVSQ